MQFDMPQVLRDSVDRSHYGKFCFELLRLQLVAAFQPSQIAAIIESRLNEFPSMARENQDWIRTLQAYGDSWPDWFSRDHLPQPDGSLRTICHAVMPAGRLVCEPDSVSAAPAKQIPDGPDSERGRPKKGSRIA